MDNQNYLRKWASRHYQYNNLKLEQNLESNEQHLIVDEEQTFNIYGSENKISISDINWAIIRIDKQVNTFSNLNTTTQANKFGFFAYSSLAG